MLTTLSNEDWRLVSIKNLDFHHVYGGVTAVIQTLTLMTRKKEKSD